MPCQRIEVDCYSNEINCPVIRVPGRRFPGVVIQGDSLHILLDLAKDLQKLSKATNDPELIEAADYLEEKLESYLEIYDSTLRENGMELPY